MARLIAYFRTVHDLVISSKSGQRLADTVRAMGAVDGAVRLGVTGADRNSLVPRRVDVTLSCLRAVLSGRRVA